MILETIVTAVQARLREDKQRVSPARMMARAEAVPAPADFPFYRALCGPAPAFKKGVAVQGDYFSRFSVCGDSPGL